MTFKDRTTQIIKLLPAVLTLIALTMRLMRMKPTFGDPARPAFWTAHPVWPAQFTNHRKAFCVIDQLLEVDHASILSESIHLLEIN